MTEHLGYDDLRADTVRQVAKLMAAAAITAPKSGGQLFLAGKHNFMETVIVEDAEFAQEILDSPPCAPTKARPLAMAPRPKPRPRHQRRNPANAGLRKSDPNAPLTPPHLREPPRKRRLQMHAWLS